MDKVLLLLMDACRFDTATRELGHFEHLVDYGQGAKYRVRGELPSLSRSMYATMFTGLPAYRHGIAANEVNKTLDLPNVFSLCKAAGGVTAMAAYGWLRELFVKAPFDLYTDRIHLNDPGAITHGIYYVQDDYPDAHLIADAEFLRGSFHPDFLMIHPMSIDYNGHIYGGDSKEYESAVYQMGLLMAERMDAWLSDGYQVVATADHGMSAYGIHGGAEDIQRDVPLYIFSPKAEPGRFEETPVSQLNMAPLLCRLLGIEPSEEMIKDLRIRLREN